MKVLHSHSIVPPEGERLRPIKIIRETLDRGNYWPQQESLESIHSHSIVPGGREITPNKNHWRNSRPRELLPSARRSRISSLPFNSSRRFVSNIVNNSVDCTFEFICNSGTDNL